MKKILNNKEEYGRFCKNKKKPGNKEECETCKKNGFHKTLIQNLGSGRALSKSGGFQSKIFKSLL